MSMTPYDPCSGLLRAGEPERFHWHHLGQDDPQDVVVFDDRLGLTHQIDSIAHAMHDCLLAHPAGLRLDELMLQLWPDEAWTDAHREAVGQLVRAMVTIQMIHPLVDATPHARA